MNSDTKSFVLQELYDIANNVNLPPRNDGWTSVKEIGGQVNFSISNETLEKYNKLCKCLLEKNKWSNKFSEPYLDSKLQSVIAEVLKASDKKEAILQQLNSLISQYENYSTKHRVYVPLSGIKVSVDKIDIGNIVLRTITEADFEQIAKNNTSKIFRGHIVGEFQDKVCSEFNIAAEPKRAKERAEEETRRVLDLLRYSIPAIYSKSMRVTIGLEHEVIRTARSALVLENGGSSFSSFGELIGPLVPFDISEKNIEHMKRIGVFTLSDILKKDYANLKDFERILLRALHWFANAQETIEREQAFLNLIICMETLLTPRDGSPIANAIAEGVAFILSKEFEARKRIKKFIKDLYKKRSGISHGGHIEILEMDFLQLRDLCGELLNQMIKRKDEFNSQKMLLEWIENQKLT